MTAPRAWAVLLSAVMVYEITTTDDELLSRGVDRARALHPVVNAGVCTAIAVTALHLTRCLPHTLDPFELLALSR